MIGPIFSQMVQLFSILIIGYILCKRDIMNADFTRRMNKIVVNITLPALILHSVLGAEGGDPELVLYLFGLAVALYLIMPFIAMGLTKLLHVPRHEEGLYAFMMVYSNIGFMGYPVIRAAYGDLAVFYASIFNIMFNVSGFTMGIWLIHRGTGATAKFNMKKLLSPGILFSLLAVAFYLLHVRLPEPVSQLIGTIGELTTPLAMLLIGATLGQMNVKEVFNDWHMYPFAVVKQILLPLASWPLIRLATADPLIQGIMLILMAMPVANTSVLFATEYGLSEKTAAKNVFFTTLISILTVPLVVMICNVGG